MPKIAISYRRADSEAMTGRIFDRLIAHYGKDAIFRDIDDIPPGIDFRVHINQTLLKTNILLAIVGPQWLGMASDGGADRIQEETDPVRVEVETALRRRVPLIPVAVLGAEEAVPVLARVGGFRQLHRVPSVPVAAPLPLPAKFRIRFLEPIDTAPMAIASSDDPGLVARLSDDIRALIQENLLELVAERRSAWLG